MIKLNLLFRAATPMVAVALGACLLAFACPAAAFKPVSKSGGENTPLNLTTPTTTTTTHTSTGGASIVRTIVGLAIVIAVIWGLTWILRQVKSGREPRVAAGDLSSVAALTLSTGRSVHLVRAGNDYLLVGSSEHGVVPIHRYSESQAREAGLLKEDQAGEQSPGSPPGQMAMEWLHPSPMGTTARKPSNNLLERMRELTVRR
jgi:flagellar protein FliO/FliZ